MGRVIIIDDNVVYCDHVGNLLAKRELKRKGYTVCWLPRKPSCPFRMMI